MEIKEVIYASATKIATLIKAKEISPVEVVKAYLQRIEEINPKLNAFVTIAVEQALEQAKRAEQALMRGGRLGPLHGVPISIKDTIETAGIRTTSGTLLRASHVPKKDASSVARLKSAGAIVLGKTNIPEMAMAYFCENPISGRTNNPWDINRTPGGSSGGEGAAIASGCSAAGIGSDLGGSIRVPSHFCGIVGLKPTPGRIPGSGHYPPQIGPFGIGSVIGPMARRVEDLILLLKILSGFDPDDAHSVNVEFKEPKGINLKRLKVAWHDYDGITPITQDTKSVIVKAVKALEEKGIPVVDNVLLK